MLLIFLNIDSSWDTNLLQTYKSGDGSIYVYLVNIIVFEQLYNVQHWEDSSVTLTDSLLYLMYLSLPQWYDMTIECEDREFDTTEKTVSKGIRFDEVWNPQYILHIFRTLIRTKAVLFATIYKNEAYNAIISIYYFLSK